MANELSTEGDKWISSTDNLAATIINRDDTTTCRANDCTMTHERVRRWRWTGLLFLKGEMNSSSFTSTRRPTSVSTISQKRASARNVTLINWMRARLSARAEVDLFREKRKGKTGCDISSSHATACPVAASWKESYVKTRVPKDICISLRILSQIFISDNSDVFKGSLDTTNV